MQAIDISTHHTCEDEPRRGGVATLLRDTRYAACCLPQSSDQCLYALGMTIAQQARHAVSDKVYKHTSRVCGVATPPRLRCSAAFLLAAVSNNMRRLVNLKERRRTALRAKRAVRARGYCCASRGHLLDFKHIRLQLCQRWRARRCLTWVPPFPACRLPTGLWLAAGLAPLSGFQGSF